MDKPTVPGFYWVRSKFINPAEWIIVEYRTETENEYGDILYPGTYQTGDEVEHFAEHYEGWIGPLQPPEGNKDGGRVQSLAGSA